MTRAEIIRRLHLMVDQLETMPVEWFEEGIYPMHKATFVSRDGNERLTLIVGISDRDE